MHLFASFNHKITEASKINLPAFSSAVFYGRGVFTTIAVYNSRSFQWKKHWQRLIENAEKIGIDLSKFTEAKVLDSLLEIINRNKLKTGRARLTFFDGAGSGIWKTAGASNTILLITTADFREISSKFRLTVSPYPVNSKSPLAGVKSCNYLENLLAFEELKKLGFDEAIRLNERAEIVSAAMANIFWTQGKEIFTTPVETGAIKGTTRDFVLENFSVTEKRISLEELKSSDEILLTSAGIGITAAESIDEKKFKHWKVFPEIKSFFESFKGK